MEIAFSSSIFTAFYIFLLFITDTLILNAPFMNQKRKRERKHMRYKTALIADVNE